MALDTSGPSYWDSLFPGYAAFEAALTDLLPPLVPVGPVPVPRDLFIVSAWFTPGGSSGLYTRLALSLADDDAARARTNAVWAQLQDQAGAAGGFSGGGFGGSFGWKAEADMAALVIPNVYRVAIEAQSGGQAVTNVVGVRGSGPGLALEAAQAVQTGWKGSGSPLANLPSTYVLQGFRALDLSSTNGAIAEVTDTTAGSITTGTKSTNGACALVKWNGGTRSRSSRGRLYFGPLIEAFIAADGRSLETGVAADIQAAFTSFRSDISAAGFTLCVISPTTSSAFDVSSVAVETIIATQRRRIRG